MDSTTRFVQICFVVFFVYWIFAAFAVKRTAETQPLGQRILRLATFVAVFLLLRLGALASPSWNLVLWHRTTFVRLMADAIVLAGLIVSLSARTTLGRNWSVSATFKENHELIECGLYHYVRHPIYTGVLLMIFGTAILFGRLLGFIALLIVFLGFWLRSLQEERLLTRHFPEAYPEYKRRVRALIPFVF